MIWGFEGGKLVKGRKRHMATDTLGLLLSVVVTEANLGDRAGADLLGAQLVGRLPRLVTLFAGISRSLQQPPPCSDRSRDTWARCPSDKRQARCASSR